MARNEVRVRNHRQRKDIERLTDQIIESGGFGFAYYGLSLFTAFSELMAAAWADIDEQETKRYGAPRHKFTPEERRLWINQASEYAFDHFNRHALDKFRTAFMELISESFAFTDSIYQQRRGAAEDLINKALPTATDLQQNVLWWSIQRQRRLPTRRREDSSEWAEMNAEVEPMKRAFYEILNNLVLWAYDHVHMHESLRQTIRPWVGKYDDPDDAAFRLANEAAELIWENIDGAAQMMSNTLVTICLSLAFQSLEQQHNAAHSEEPVQVTPPMSATKLKKIAAQFLDSWFKVLSVKLKKRGRNARKLATEERETKRAEFIQQVEAAIKELPNPDKGSVGLKLGYGKSKAGLEPTKEAAAKALREKARRFGVNMGLLIGKKEKKNRTKKSK